MSVSPDLTTRYLGCTLAHPFMLGASPLADDLDVVRRLEDAGCAAVVVRSLFEEQVTVAQTGRIHHLDPLDPRFADVLSYFPETNRYSFGPDEYLEHVRRIKAAVRLPVFASLNGTSGETWLSIAGDIERAGADALEINMYSVIADPHQSAASIESDLVHVVRELKAVLTIPVAVKLSPFFTALSNVAHQLEEAGADSLVLFNRFYQPDIDVRQLAVVPRVDLSTNAELLLRLRWTAILHGRIRPAIAVSGGVASAVDGVKALLAGADVVQAVSAIIRHGPSFFAVLRDGLVRWMEETGSSTLGEVRGRVSLERSPDPAAFERANYIRTLGSWPSSRLPASQER